MALGKYSNLQPGDVLDIPYYSPDSGAWDIVIYSSVVLSREADLIILSIPSSDKLSPAPFVEENPHLISDDGQTLLGRDGKRPPWFSGKIRVLPHSAPEVVVMYEEVPRARDRASVVRAEATLAMFTQRDPRYAKIRAIARHGESVVAQMLAVCKLLELGEMSSMKFAGLCAAVLNITANQRVVRPSAIMRAVERVRQHAQTPESRGDVLLTTR